MPTRLRFLGLLFPLALAGCGNAAHYASTLVQDGDKRNGIVFYVGGAGPVGHVGSMSVPQGISDTGFRGYVEVFPWQGIGAAVDQVNISRNRGKAMDFADLIKTSARHYPNVRLDVIALSAGTGITAFALEYLPEEVHVRNVVFLGCSLSSKYDLTRALKRVDGRLYVFYSPEDNVLAQIVPYTGTVDRADAADGVAGLSGFALPRMQAADTLRQYQKVFNIPYQERFATTGYDGGHMSSTSRDFVAQFLAPLLFDRKIDLMQFAQCPVARPKHPRAAARPSAHRSAPTTLLSPRPTPAPLLSRHLAPASRHPTSTSRASAPADRSPSTLNDPALPVPQPSSPSPHPAPPLRKLP